jgi:hypothetical protein
MRWAAGRLLLLVGAVAFAACRDQPAQHPQPEPEPMSEFTGVAFPRQRPGEEAAYEALIEGRLSLERGCLRLVSPEGESYLVLWPSGAELLEGPRVSVPGTGLDVGPGDVVRMSGGEVEMHERTLRRLESAPPGGCGGPYWLAGRLLTD